jgi:hypothetical protein
MGEEKKKWGEEDKNERNEGEGEKRKINEGKEIRMREKKWGWREKILVFFF